MKAAIKKLLEFAWWRLYNLRAAGWEKLAEKIECLEFIAGTLDKSPIKTCSSDLQMLKSEIKTLKRRRDSLERKMRIYRPPSI